MQNTSSSYPRSHPLSCPEVCSSQALSSFSTCRLCPLRHFLEGEESSSAAHRSSDVLCSLWRSPAMSLLRTCFSSLIKARFPGRAVIQETTLPVSSVQGALPDAAQPWLGLPPVMMFLQLISVRSGLVQLRVVLKIPFASSSWSMGSPRMTSVPLPAPEVELSSCLFL